MTSPRVRFCRRCVMPETRPDLHFDAEGVCDACRSAHLKEQIDWAARRLELGEILERYRNRAGSNYDCLIPVSGGKDSHYQTYVIKHEFGLNPLCVTWTPCHQTEIGRRNIRNLQRLGVDYVEVTGNPHVYSRLVRLGFELIGDNCWPEHVGIFTVPVQVAIRYRVPLLVWGESSQFEYGGPEARRQTVVLDRRWLEEFGGLRGLRVEDALHLLGLTRRDLLPYLYPSPEELESAGIHGIFLGQYLRWDARSQVELVKKHGFNVLEDGPQEGTYTNYENLDCGYMALHDYLMYCKYGFGRATSHACIDIRLGRLTREEGLALVRRHEGRLPRRYWGEFLRELEMTEDEFYRICDVFTNKTLFATDPEGRPVRDEDGELIKLYHDNGESEAPALARAAALLARRRAAPARGPARAADVTVVDYGMGNLRSVVKAFETLGARAVVTARPADLERAERIVLPGDGAFADGMRHLRDQGLLDVLRARVLDRRAPFLGICLGMQVLAERGTEHGVHAGLGWLAGETVRLAPADPGLKVPHIGWDDVTAVRKSTLLAGLDGPTAFYFVHGYHLAPRDPGVVMGVVDYGGAVAAVVEVDNIFATQFHPEKSQRAGLTLLRNFLSA